MHVLAVIVHYTATAVMIGAALVIAAIILPFVAVYRMLRWAELQYVYRGDAQARDKDRWRGI